MGIQSSSSISIPSPEKQSTKVDETEVVTNTTTNNDDDDNMVTTTTTTKNVTYTCAQLQDMYDRYEKKSMKNNRDKTPKERIDQFTQYILYTNNRGGKTCNMHIERTNITAVTHIAKNMQDIFVDVQFVVKCKITPPDTFMVTATWEKNKHTFDKTMLLRRSSLIFE